MARRTTPPDPPTDPPTEEPTAAPTEATDEAPTAAPAASDASPASAESGFFAWIRALDLVRGPGWLGGVCAGVADKLGIDPIIVRGIVVVIAVLGGPIALVYAVAWFLLPGPDGTIHAQELGHGRVTRALPGIVAVFLLSFLPLAQGVWFAGSWYWGDPSWLGAVLRAVWTGVVIAVAVVIVVWLARRASEAEVPTSPATTDDRPETVPQFPADAAAGVGVAAAVVAAAPAPTSAPGEPPAPPTDASAEELAAWKRSQDEWQQQRAAWAAEQKRHERERRQAEAHERAVATAEAARERARIRKLTRPRANAGVVLLIFGLALIAGGVAWFAASSEPASAPASWSIGIAVGVLVLGVGTVAVAAFRRRSGALTFFGILGVLALLTSLAIPTDRQLIPFGASWSIDTSQDGRFAQFAGYTNLSVRNDDAATDPVDIDLWQPAGYVSVQLDEGATFRLEFENAGSPAWVAVDEQTSAGGRSSQYWVGSDAFTLTVGDGEPDVVLHLWGASTTVYITARTSDGPPVTLDPAPDHQQLWNENGVEVLPTPTPSPAVTDGTTDDGGN